jgi:hypothetical protein
MSSTSVNEGSDSLSNVTETSGTQSDSERPQGVDLPLPPFEERDGGSDNMAAWDGGLGTSLGADSDASAPADPDGAGPYEVGGSVEGLVGELVLLVGDEEVVLTSDGPFSVGGFADADPYEVTVVAHPVGQRCDIANSTGTIEGADVDDVVVDCLGDVATLAELSVSPKQLSPDFAADTFAYEVELSLVSQALQVRAEPSDPAAFVVINQSTVDVGAVHSLPLQLGANTISISVTAPSGRTESYVVTATRTEELPEPRALALPAGVIFAEPFIERLGETLVVYTKDTVASGPLALLYHRENGQWAYVANLEDLVADDISQVENVMLCNGWLFMTASLSGELAGYVFSNANGNWVFDSTLPSEAEAPAVLLACEGNTTVTYLSSTGFTTDSFESLGAAWTFSNIGVGYEVAFGQGIIAAGYYFDNTAAVGVNGDEVATCPEPTNCLQESGAVRIFEPEGQGWAQTVYLKPQNPQSLGLFGRHLAMFGQHLVVGFPGDSCAFRGVTNTPPSTTCTGDRSGSVYVYELGAGWSDVTYIKAEGVSGSAIFGFGIWGYGDLMFVGAPEQEPHSDVYVFLHDGSIWRQMPQPLTIPELPDGGDYPLSAALDGLGFYAADHDASAGGTVYLYED